MPSSSSPEMSPNTPVPATAVYEQLARIVNSPRFVSSARLCRFLTHIVNRTIQGDLDGLKEFSIAVEVFDRSSKYDPNIDAIVRVEARRLRAKLKEYYEGPGRNDPVLIGLRPGSYVPTFRWLDTEPRNRRQEIGTPIQAGAASVAVLPFVNMSPDPELEYFCDGITEEIINSLMRIVGLKVIARSSAFQLKGMSVDVREVGRRLDADLVIEGSVRKAGDQLRITVHAIHAGSRHDIWSEICEPTDVFAIQEEIAQSVVGLLRPHMPEPRAPVRAYRNLEAYTKYLKARVLYLQQSPETLRAALKLLRELIEAFPEYALAHSGIAAVHCFLALFGVVSGRDVYSEAKATAERGYALDPELADTCTVLAAVRSAFELRWNETQALCERALKVQPGSDVAYIVRGMAWLSEGKINEAESALRRQSELDPLTPGNWARLAYLYYVKGDYRSAEEHLQKSFDLDRDYPEARFYTGLLHFQKENFETVIQCLSGSDFPLDIGLLAAAYTRKGCGALALESVEKLSLLAETQYVTPLAEALARTGMEQTDLAFRRLDEAIDQQTTWVNMLLVEPFFAPLRSDYRFTGLLKKLNLVH